MNPDRLDSYKLERIFNLIFISILFCVVILSLTTLTTRPKIWTDEAITMDLANNWLKFGVLDLEISPGRFSGIPHLLQSSGYPLTLTLAGIFKILGYGLVVSRLAMLAIMITTLSAVYLLGKKILGAENALASVLLIATFASFHGNGRTAVGEVPGFIFLLASLYFLFYKGKPYLTGLFMGLAIATKPSVFLMTLPSMILAVITEKKEPLNKIIKIIVGTTLPIGLWVMLVIGNPLASEVWINILNFFKNPYGSGALESNVYGNLISSLNSTTILYFGILYLVIIIARYWENNDRLKILYNFVTIYGVFAYFYYLRSPGWLRYIFIAELLILFALPTALNTFSSWLISYSQKIRLDSQQTARFFISSLATLQFIQMLVAADIYSSNSTIKTANFINEGFPQQSVGIINSLPLSALLKTNKKYQTFDLTGISLSDKDFLLIGDRPQVIAVAPETEIQKEKSAILEEYYDEPTEFEGYKIYTQKTRN